MRLAALHVRRGLLASMLAAAVVIVAAACTAPDVAGGASPGTAPPAPDAVAVVPATPDLACKVAGDCAVKNVGNCCGYFPACVSKDSPVDPEAVRAECARTGTSSLCGWQDIQSCDCVQGQCRARTGPLEAKR